MAQAKQQATLSGLWEEAARLYNADLKRFDEEYEKKHSHVWNVHRYKKPSAEIPTMYSAKDFTAELEKKKSDFRDMRMKGHTVFKAMNNLAMPVEIIGGQASAIGSMFMPATPMVFGAVMYLFNAGRDVHDGYNVLEKLFNKCADAIKDISMMVNGVRYLKIELQNTVIETLTAILEVFRTAAEFAKNKRFSAYVDALRRPGKGGPEKQSLERLKELGKRQNTQVNIANLIGIDVLDQKHDKTDGKIDLSPQLRRRLSQLSTIDAKQRSEDKGHRLKNLLHPEASVFERAREFPATTAPGTCEWIFKEPKYQIWEAQPDVPILWIYGDSGVGKSHLAAKIAKNRGPSHLFGAKETARAEVAALFIEYADSQTPTVSESEDDSAKNEKDPADTPVNTNKDGDGDELQVKIDTSSEPAILIGDAPQDTTIIEDPIEEDNNLPLHNDPITEILRTLAWQLSEDEKNANELKVWDYLFNKYFTPPYNHFVTFVIDGIDNLGEGQRKVLYRLIIQVVQAFKENGNGAFRLVCLSQPTLEKEISRAFASHFQMPSTMITKEKNLPDIETYISWTIDQSTKLKRALKDKTFRQAAVAELARCTGGVFEMGSLLLKQLAQKDHVDLFSEVLENPPADIHSILTETLEHFGDTHTLHDVTDLNSLLSWILYAYGSLTLGQLNAAIGLESEHGEFLDIRDQIERECSAYFSIVDYRHQDTSSQSFQLPTKADTIPLLGTGIDIHAENLGAEDDDLEVPIVKVAHTSIAKFFRNSEISNHASIGVSREDAHLRLAKTCLRAICYNAEENSKPWKSKTTTERLHTYAITYFSEHLMRASTAFVAASVDEKVEIFRLLTRLMRDEEVIAQWARDIQFWPDFFDMNSSLGAVWSCCSDKDVLNALGDEEKQWVIEPCPSTVERLLKPIAMWHAKNWLQNPNPEGNNEFMYFFMMLRSLLNLFERSKEVKESEEIPLEHPKRDHKAVDIRDETSEGKDSSAKNRDGPDVSNETPATTESDAPEGDKPEEEIPIYGRQPFEEAWEINGDRDEILRVAEWAGLEKTALWHCRVAYCVTLLTRPITEEALIDLKISLGLDPDFGQAYFKLATAHGGMEQYDLAISQMEDARRLKYNESFGSVRRGAIWIAKWQEARANTPDASEEAKDIGRQQAMKTLEAEFEKYPEEFDLLALYIGIAGRSGKHKAIMSRLLRLGERLPDFIRSGDVQTSDGLHKFMRRAAQNTRWVGVLKRAYEIAIEKDSSDKVTISQPGRVYYHIDLIEELANLYTENQEDDKGLIRYQDMIDYADEKDVGFYAYSGAMRVAQLHLLAAINKGSSEKEKKDAVDALIKLEKEERDADNNVISASYTTHGLTLGFYYNLIGEHEKAHALFKDRIALAMALLDDDDADNDWQGWENLALTFFKDGDIENGKAAAGMWHRELKRLMAEALEEEETDAKDEDGEKSTKGATADTETNGKATPAVTKPSEGSATNGSVDAVDTTSEKPQSSPIYEGTPWQTGPCDGICDRNLKDYDKGMYMCIHCTSMWLCVECWEKHRESSLPCSLCDSDHEFAYVTGPPKNLCVEKGKGEIWVGGRVRGMEEWLESIWERWGVKKGEGKEEVGA